MRLNYYFYILVQYSKQIIIRIAKASFFDSAQLLEANLLKEPCFI